MLLTTLEEEEQEEPLIITSHQLSAHSVPPHSLAGGLGLYLHMDLHQVCVPPSLDGCSTAWT
jgi:hypothetical protein